MSIVTYPLNGIDYDAENAEIYLCTRISGIYSAEGMFSASVTGDREVTISEGLAWIQNVEYHGKAVYNDSPVAVAVPIANSALPRIDRIVLRFSKSENLSEIVLIEGTPASNPQPPEVSRTELVYDLGLCTVSVAASSVVVNEGDVESTLLDEEVCGLMRDGVTGIPTQDLYDTFMAWYREMQEKGEEVYNTFMTTLQEAQEKYTTESTSAYEAFMAALAEMQTEYTDKSTSAYEGFMAALNEMQTEYTDKSTSAYEDFFATLEKFEGDYTTEFEEWFATIKDILDENVAAKLEQAIEELQSEVTGMTGSIESAQTTAEAAQTTAEAAQTAADEALAAAQTAQSTADAAQEAIKDLATITINRWEDGD